MTEIFNHRFDEQEYKKFIIEVLQLDESDCLMETIYETRSSTINYITNIARYTADDGSRILVALVNMKTSVERSRTLQRNYIGKYLKEFDLDAAVVALYCECEDLWRISFVKLDVVFEEDSFKLLEELSPAKRFSYIVNPNIFNHTVQQQFTRITTPKPDVKKLEEVFSLEIVSDEFFKLYKEKHLELKELVKSENVPEDFSKRFIGQIVLLYFIQKKGWLGASIVPESIPATDMLSLLSDKPEIYTDIANSVYSLNGGDTLEDIQCILDEHKATELSDDSAVKLETIFRTSKYNKTFNSGDTSFIRNLFNFACEEGKNFFRDYLVPLFSEALNQKRSNSQYYKALNCKIPFMGGDAFKSLCDIEIPNAFFSNEEKNGLLDLFDLYNFTVDENQSLDKDIAIEPDMLGRVYEDLMDPEERRRKGAYYTPRKIVEYMCKEVLMDYLEVKTGIQKVFLSYLIKYGEIIKDADYQKEKNDDYKMPEIILNNLLVIDEALANITVIDPSSGSGSFSLGMLMEIVNARKIITDYLTINMFSSGRRVFKRKSKRTTYDLKVETIRNSIYAVDIDESALAITKMRLWLCLILDMDFKRVRTLPNLDYHIMLGNSLIGECRGTKFIGNQHLNQLKTTVIELYKLKNKHFENNPELSMDIENHCRSLLNKILGYTDKTSNVHDKSCFLWELCFSEVFLNGGFDVVIGNPPYLGARGNKDLFSEIKSTEFGSKYSYRFNDLYYYFFYLGVNILKKNGILSFITSNNYFTTESATPLRKFIKNNTDVMKVLDFNNVSVFDSAGCTAAILTLKKAKQNEFCEVLLVPEDMDKLVDLGDDFERFYETTVKQDRLYSGDLMYLNLRSNDSEIDSILNKLQTDVVYLGDIANIFSGIITGADKVSGDHIKAYGDKWERGEGIFVLTQEELDDLELNDYEQTLIKKIYYADNIEKYSVTSSDKYLIYMHNSVNIEDIPNIVKHLNKYKEILDGRSNDTGYKLNSSRNQKLLNNPEKIVVSSYTNVSSFALMDGSAYGLSGIWNIIVKNYNSKYILAFLNSKLAYIWFKYMGSKARTRLKFTRDVLEQVPIKVTPKPDEYIKIVDEILNGGQKKELMKKLDKMFYKLYGLTEKEIAYIEDKIGW